MFGLLYADLLGVRASGTEVVPLADLKRSLG